MSGHGFVYVISGKYQKIGHSRSPQSRLDHFKTASPYKLTLAFTLECWNAERAERDAHIALASKRMSGEWFDITADEAVSAVRAAVDAVDAQKPAVMERQAAAVEKNAAERLARANDVARSFLVLLQRIQWEVAQHYDETREIVLSAEVEGRLIDTLSVNRMDRWESYADGGHLVPFDDGWAPIGASLK